MRALRLTAPRTFQWDDDREPLPGPGEVVIAVRAVGVCASDIHMYSHGRIGDTALQSPLILGHELSGVIAATGLGVTHVKVGQLVAVDPAVPCGTCEPCSEGNPNLCRDLRFFGTWPYDGALRERLSHPANLIHPLGESLTAVDGAMLEPLGVAIHGVDLGHLRPGCSVSIHGCGPIGLLVLQVARAAGAARLLAVEPIPGRRAMALKMGADHAIDVDGSQVEQILRSTGGRGVDVAFEAAGENQAVEDAVEVAKPGGRVVLIGIPPDDRTHFRASAARRKGLTILLCRRMRHTYPRAMGLAESGRIDLRTLVTHRVPLEEAPHAFDLVERRADGVVKAVIESSAS